MKAFTGYETRDGVIHNSYANAKGHAEKRYDDYLTKMAHELVRIEKYSEMLDKLDGYKDSMQHLLNLSADLDIEVVEED